MFPKESIKIMMIETRIVGMRSYSCTDLFEMDI